ncbi:non-ribosomal peptide synthetase/type I polyketide synthase [Actinophytocola algeriensis]|uniref:non-ribosomal peptide synthetase/type I polyketide synthase n=1 Tax=Actinophytocola algeriensis TaxID=1768010 RepID=UPI002892F209|nr:non-ribosomal peptide synthetase/type I polyketide synthase [Actinophytocola algeriensis]
MPAGEPVAIVGMGCRYPRTISSPDELWDFVVGGGSAATPGFPADRGWDLAALTATEPGAPGATYVRGASFVDGAGDFDPSVFGISPREALAMDPQQRLLLEVSWEAVERAGIDPTALAGTRAGVYFGVVAQEYGPRVYLGDADQAGHLTTGTAPSVASGRVAYTLGLEGPAVTVDTACSSSLVAIHLAVRALRAGECSLALAGGANVVCAPSILVGFAHLGALAPDGLSKPFSAAADGFGVSEGAGVLVLERLSDALRHGHDVLAVLRGTAIGQDGASDGLSVPNEAGQRRVILDALADAGLSPADIDVVEAHGTGTRVGDPIEARALLATYGAARSAATPLLVGSVKSNIGHPQAASGVAGVIKAVEAIRHAEVPGTLHLAGVTDAVDWSPGTVRVVGETTRWPSSGAPRRAAVSSFGISGTNAHVIVEQAPDATAVVRNTAAPGVVVPLVLSAKTDAALREQAARLHAHLTERTELSLPDVAHTLAGRARFEHRAVLVAGERTEALNGLAALADGRPDAAAGCAGEPGVVFVFPGQGSQWAGMAVELLAASPVFAAEIAACDRVFAEFTDWSLLDVLRGRAGAPGLDRVDVVQPALFAVMVSLARCWQSFGVEPAAVIGHSQGEIAAAYVAGALSLRDAARIVTLRSKAIVDLAGTGGMVSVPLGAADVEARLARWAGRLGVAAVNGPRSTVVSGDAEAVDEFLAHCAADDLRARRIPVDYASHSAHVEALEATLAREFDGIAPMPCRVDLISTTTGGLAEGPDLDAGYWYRNLRRTVGFEHAVRVAHDRGHRIFVEVSPHPVLTVGVEETLQEVAEDGTTVVTGSLRRDEGGLRRLLASVAEVHVAGEPADLVGYLRDHEPRHVDLPGYAFQRKRYWLPPGTGEQTGPRVPGGVGHPFLAAAHDHPENDGLQFTGVLSQATHPWLADHAVHGVVLLPGAAVTELAMFAGQQAGCPAVTELVLHEPLVIPAGTAVLVRVVVADTAAGDTAEGRAVRIYSRTESADRLDVRRAWTRHAEGVLAPEQTVQDTAPDVWPPAGAEPVDVSDGYERLARRGYEYGPAFRGLRAVWRHGDDVHAEVALPDGVGDEHFCLHPALLDAALHAFQYAAAGREAAPDTVLLPFAWEGVRLHAVGASALRVSIVATAPDVYRLTLRDPDGRLVCTVDALTLRPIDLGRLRAAGTRTGDSLFGLEWTPVTQQAGPDGGPSWAEWPSVSPSGVTVLRCVPQDEPAGADLPRRTRQALLDVLQVAQRVLTEPEFDVGTLVVLTGRAVSTGAGEDVADLVHAPVWGLLRSAQTENPGRIVLADVDDWSAWREVVSAALASGEPQLAVRHGVARVPRVVRAAPAVAGVERLNDPDWRLTTRGEGTLDAGNMALTSPPATPERLAGGQVRVAVRAVGLNFRDVMIGYGLYPDPEVDLGNEVAGVVVEVADDVEALKPGDRVMGMCYGVGPQAVRDHRYFSTFPATWSFEQAAAIPAAFLTAYCSLRTLAAITAGQRVLVHAATGGVGMAAIQLARHWGAEVFATAGTPKWTTLWRLGFDEDHVADSRTLEFRERFLDATGGAGVDIVLDSLAGEFVDASLDLLPRGGHFVELGKTDIRAEEEVAEHHPGVSYRHFDLTRVGPAEVGAVLAELAAMFDRGDLRPLPVSVRDVRQMPEALTFLSQARHTGKLALTIPRTLDPDGTVLITGGTGVLGASLARHLVARYGVRHLLLLSRGGPDTPAAKELARDLTESAGADVRILACDVADRDSLGAALAQVPARHPLTAVVHAAGVLDDAVFGALSPDRLDRVLRPKVDAAWHLHRATERLDLAMFVLFSSAAGILGTAGQANYAASNTFLDALAEHRRQRGLPATSLAWGLWAQDSGMTGHLDDRDRARLTGTGFIAMSIEDGLALFDAAVASGRPLLVPAHLELPTAADVGEWPPVLRGFARPALRVASTGRDATRTPRFADGFGGMTADEQRAAVLELVRGVAADVLRHESPEAIDPGMGFKEMGFDSLGGVEFRNRLRKATRLPVPANAVFEYRTPLALTEHLLTLVAPASPEPVRSPVPEAPPTVVDGTVESTVDTTPALPLSRYQRDVVAVALTYPDLPLSQPTGYFRLRGATDVDRMRRAIRRTALRHDAMRLRFEVDGDELRQRVRPGYPDVEVVSFLAEPDPKAACLRWIAGTTDTVIPLDGSLAQAVVLVDDTDSLVVYCRFHHAAADAWGINIVIREIREAYRSGDLDTAAGRAPSCLDAVRADEEYRRSPDWQADRDALVAAVTPLRPALFARNATVRGHHRRQTSFDVDAATADRIRATGRSIFSVTAAALATYLRRTHRDGDIVLGIPLLNRRTPTELSTMSHVTNALPLHVPVDESRTLLDLADRIRADVWDLSARQRFALGDLRAALREHGVRDRDLFDVTFSYITVPAGELDADVDLTVLSSGYSLDAVNIVVREHESDGSLSVDVFHAEDVFDDAFSFESVTGHVTRLLDNALRAPETPVGELAVLGPDEVAAIAGFERGPEVGFDEAATLDVLVAAQVARSPERAAVVGTDADGNAVTLSYAAFGQAVARLAARLRAGGIRPEECVPVLLPRSVEFLVAVHAVHAAGGAYVPVDPDHPEERVRTVLTDCGARVAVADTRSANLLADLGIRSVTPSGEDSGAAPVAAAVRPTDLAYVIYTSGSTGIPKGVMIEHRSVVNRLAWMQRRYPLGADDVVLHKTPATFDVSVWELMWWAHVGARVAVAPAGAERDPRELAAAIERHGVTVVHFVPAMLGPFLDHVEENPGAGDQVRTLRRVFCSGEALVPALADRFRSVFAAAGLPEVRLVNLYGPTETTVDVSYFDIPPSGPVERVPIGRPIDNTALMVLDAAGRRCPVGVPGELNIAGTGVGRGYLGQPALTGAAFVVDESVPRRRRYRTGDLVRWLADGTVEFLGRLDDQVKVRGNRVTLGEIESVLARCPHVAAAVVLDEHTDSGTRLVAYLVPASADRSALTASVVDFLAQRLPAYMIPAEFVQVDELPLTPSGKADRQALAALGRHEHGTDEPSNPVEKELAEIWTDLLGSSAFGVRDDFFTVGGDSILVLRMRTEAEKRGLGFDVERFYTRPTIAGLAAQVADPGARPAGDTGVPAPFELVPLIDRAGIGEEVEDAFPATRLQLGMLYHSMQSADSALYKDVFAYRLRMPWREDEFRRAYDRLVRRQPALRSNFDLTGRSTPLQLVYREVEAPLVIVGDGDLDEYLADAAHAPYPLVSDRSGAPSALHGMRVFVRPGHVDLVVNFHHAILDGWSVANLVSELLRDYLSHGDLPASGLPCSTLLLAEHARAERESLDDAATRRFWDQALAGARTTTIEPARRHVAPGDDDVRTMSLPRWLDRSVKEFALRHRLPLKSVLLTAHCLALGMMSGSDDVVTGAVTHARPERDGADLCAGLFINTVPVRLDVRRQTWREAVARIVRWERDAFRHRRLPVAALDSGRDLPVFGTAFNFVSYHNLGDVLGDVPGDIELTDVTVREETNFALLNTVLVDPRDSRISLRISTGGDTLTGAQCAEFGRAFVELLGEMVRELDSPVDLARARRHDVTEMVARVAALRPAATAVADDAEEQDYRGLSDAADTVAQELLARGMPPGARVAVHMRRSVDLIAVVLGVMRAGAAVVPLDPAYPAARLREMAAIACPYLTVADQDGAAVLAEVTTVVEPAALLGGPGADAPALPRIDLEDVAYVLFTSGSTGEPKGVALPHRALANLIEWQNRRASGAVGATTLQFAPLSFDVSFQEIFSTLAGGGTLRMIADEVRQDMGAVLGVINRAGVRRVFLPYVALQALAEVAAATGEYPASLRWIVSSGEQLRITPEIRALCGANPATALENQYGPTETHVVLAHELPAAVADHPALPPVGTAVAHTGVSLLDERLRPVPPGVKGEIYVEGPAVALGYENRPALTAQRFVAGPRGSVRYRTGDIGISLANGDIVCLGRADGQVKVRGYRVESAEVELALLAVGGKHHGIEQVAVVPSRLGGADAVLRAFLVGGPHRAGTDTLRAELRQVLPPHMVPSTFQWVDAIPLTPSGKRDDAALRALGARRSPAVGDQSPPGDDLEVTVAGVLAEFAGLDELAVDTSFFDAGGTSIGATRVAMTIARRWGVELPLHAFLAGPTARELAAAIRSRDDHRAFDPVVPLREHGDGPPLFLVHPIGGNVFCYRELVRHLPAGRAVYGLQAAGAEPGTVPMASMEAIADSYLAAIRRVHPAGAFHLAGWSFGGYVAYEIAGRLDEAELSTVTLLDTMAIGDGPRTPLDEKQLILLFFRELLWYSGGEERLAAEPDPVGENAGDLFDAVLRTTIELGILPADGSPQLLRRLYGVFRANYQATIAYRFEKLDRRLLVLRATEELPSAFAGAHRALRSMFASPDNGWRHWAGSLAETVTVPGNHLSMLDTPQVGVVAARLGDAMRHADTGNRPEVD